MKGILLLLMLFLASALPPIYAQENCFDTQLEAIYTTHGSPLEGPYLPGERIGFHLQIFNYSQLQWLHGVVPQFGDGFVHDTPNSDFGLMIDFPLTNYSNQGDWVWYEYDQVNYTGTSSDIYFPGQPVGGGWFYTRPGVPINNGFGDQNAGRTIEMYFSIDAILHSCEQGSYLDQITFKTFSDSEVGIYPNQGCYMDRPLNFPYAMGCCEELPTDFQTDYIICNGQNFTLDLPAVAGNHSFSWSQVIYNNIEGGTDGSGDVFSQQLINYAPFAQTATFFVTSENLDPECAIAPMFINLTVLPNDLQGVLQSNQAQICEGECVNLFFNGNLGSGNWTYEWSNGEVTNVPTLEDCSNPADGIYWVIVSNTQNACSQFFETTVLTEPNPVADAGPDVAIPCSVTSVFLNGSSNIPQATFTWTGPDGSFLQGPFIEVSLPGIYELVVSSPSNCTATDQVIVSRQELLGAVDAGPDQYIRCDTDFIQLQASLSTSNPNLVYDWSTVDGNIVADPGSLTPLVTEGTYTIRITDVTTQCVGMDEVVVYPSMARIEPIVNANDCSSTSVLLDGSNSLQEADVQYEWLTTDGNILGPMDGNQIEIDQVGTYQLIVTDSTQCSDTAMVTIEELRLLPMIAVSPDQELTCTITELTLNGTIINPSTELIASWLFNGVVIASSTDITISNPGLYQFIVNNTLTGCTVMEEVLVEDNTTLPQIAFSNNVYNLSCLNGPTVDLDAIDSSMGNNFAYQWEGPAGATIIDGNTLSPQVDAVGEYTLIISNENNGCTAQGSVVVEDLSFVETVQRNIDCDSDFGSIEIIAMNIDSPIYSWSNGATTSAIDQLSVGDYQLTVSGTNAVCEATFEFTITEDLNCKVTIGGTVVEDVLPANCQADALEGGLEDIIVHLDPLGLTTTTDANGYYEFSVNPGVYTIRVEPREPYLLQCSNGQIPVDLTTPGAVSINNDFYLQVLTNFDLIVNGQSSVPRPGMLQNYNLSYCNFGFQTVSGYLQFTHDPQLIWPNPEAAGVSSYDPTTGTATWEFTNLSFFACGSVQFSLLVPEGLATGTSIESELQINPVIGDLNPANNSRTWTRQVQGSTTIPASIAPIASEQSKAAGALLQVHRLQPNPFREKTQLVFDLAQSESVRLQVFDLSGRLLMDRIQDFAKGRNEWLIDGAILPASGVLIYHLVTSGERKVGKMMKLN